MAEGLLLLLVGDECKNKEKYLGLDKEYEVEVLLGFETDTGDLLGKVKSPAVQPAGHWLLLQAMTGGRLIPQKDMAGKQNGKVKIEIQKEKVKEILKSLEGKFVQKYPRYSSKIIAMSINLAIAKNIDIKNEPEKWPTKEVEIYKIEFIGKREISSSELLQYIEENISKVTGDFRQSEIISLWRGILQDPIFPPKADPPLAGNFSVIKIKVNCSSGTYMRVLAEKIGIKLGITALAFSIRRIKIGEFVI